MIAVWMWRHFSLSVEVWDDEMAAARCVMEIEDDGAGTLGGVSFPDGTFIDRSNWAALQIVREEAYAEWEAAYKKFELPPTKLRVPHRGLGKQQKIAVPLDTPEWVFGRITDEREQHP